MSCNSCNTSPCCCQIPYQLPGPMGPQGCTGIQGNAGPQGPPGPTGPVTPFAARIESLGGGQFTVAGFTTGTTVSWFWDIATGLTTTTFETVPPTGGITMNLTVISAGQNTDTITITLPSTGNISYGMLKYRLQDALGQVTYAYYQLFLVNNI